MNLLGTQRRAATLGTVLLAAASLAGLGQGRADPVDDEKVIKIVAQKFSYTPNEIVLKKGEPVTLEFTALDFVHGFKVPALNVRANLPPGKPTLVHLTPDKTGRFVFLCDNFCGAGHEDMNGVFIVTE